MDLHSIKREFEKKQCSKHHKHPKVLVDGSNLKFECCCESFRQHIEKEAAQTIEKHIADEIKKMFGK